MLKDLESCFGSKIKISTQSRGAKDYLKIAIGESVQQIPLQDWKAMKGWGDLLKIQIKDKTLMDYFIEDENIAENLYYLIQRKVRRAHLSVVSGEGE